MNSVPYKIYILNTNLSLCEVRQRLQDNTEPRKSFRSRFFGNRLTRLYEGEIYENTFRISRNTYGNRIKLYFPIIEGEISENFNGAEVRIKMRMDPYVYIFFLIFLAVLLFALIQMFFRKQFDTDTAVFLLLIGVNCLPVFWVFNSESAKSKDFLCDLFSSKNQE